VAKEGLTLQPDAKMEAMLQTNHAHALLFLGKFEESKQIYTKYRNAETELSTFWEECLNDFEALIKAGVIPPQEEFKEIKKILEPDVVQQVEPSAPPAAETQPAADDAPADSSKDPD
jgi:hypothetical protein